MNPTKREDGFTLLEIMIALAVIGLMAGAVMIGLDGLTQSERLRSAVRRMAGMSDLVRSSAAGAQHTCYLDIDFDQHVYRFRRLPPRDSQGRFVDAEDDHILSDDEVARFKNSFDWEELPKDVYFRRLYFSEKRYYDKGPIEVEYSSLGTLNSFILHIQGGKAGSENVEYYSIVVNGLTGKAEVKQGLVGFATAAESDFSSVMGTDAPGNSGR